MSQLPRSRNKTWHKFLSLFFIPCHSDLSKMQKSIVILKFQSAELRICFSTHTRSLQSYLSTLRPQLNGRPLCLTSEHWHHCSQAPRIGSLTHYLQADGITPFAGPPLRPMLTLLIALCLGYLFDVRFFFFFFFNHKLPEGIGPVRKISAFLEPSSLPGN